MRGDFQKGGRKPPEEKPVFIKPEEILNPPADYDKFLERIKNFVEKEMRNVKTHQIRNIFSALQKAIDIPELKRLRYRLAYNAGRMYSTKPICDLLDEAIKNAKSEEHLKNIKDFFEAVVAYHKYCFPRG